MLHFKGTPPLETERLLLRRINDGDLNEIYQYASNEKVTQYVLWETHESLEDTKDFYRNYVQANLENDHGADWAIIRKEDGTFLGSIGLMNPDFDTNTVEVGYVLGEDHWGKGYMSEALDRIVGFVFHELSFETVIGIHHINNKASGRVMEKAGLKGLEILAAFMEVKGKMWTVKRHKIHKKSWLECHN